jgi:hypothetical protein
MQELKEMRKQGKIKNMSSEEKLSYSQSINLNNIVSHENLFRNDFDAL